MSICKPGFFLPLLLSASWFQCGVVSAQLNQEALRNIVQEDIKEGRIELKAPKIKEPTDGGTELVYSFLPRDAFCESCKRVHRDLKHGIPIDYPIALQTKVEEFRTHRPQQFWDPYLAQIEVVIESQLTLINDQNTDPAQLNANLLKLHEKGFEIIDNAIAYSAQTRGWTAKREPIIAGPAPNLPSYLRITTTPGGAVIYQQSKHGYDRLVRYKAEQRTSEWYLAKSESGNWISPASTRGAAAVILAYWPDTGITRIVGPFEVEYPNGFVGNFYRDVQISAN